MVGWVYGFVAIMIATAGDWSRAGEATAIAAVAGALWCTTSRLSWETLPFELRVNVEPPWFVRVVNTRWVRVLWWQWRVRRLPGVWAYLRGRGSQQPGGCSW